MKDIKLRLKAIEEIKKGRSFEEIANEIGVSMMTIRRWFKRYLKGGVEELTKRKYIPPWNITPKDICDRVYLLKEMYPGITLKNVQKKLKEEGIYLSLGCIRKIWYKYGVLPTKTVSIFPIISFSKDVKILIEKAKDVLEKEGEFKKAAGILNNIPYCFNIDILNEIPWRYLNLRRKLEKIVYLFGKESMNKYYKRIHSLRLKLENKNLFYSSLRAGIVELNTLFWLGRPEEMLLLIKHLEEKIPGKKDKVIYFLFNLLKGMALARLLKLDEALKCAKICKKVIDKIFSYEFYISLGHLYSNIGNYSEARKLYEEAIKHKIVNPEVLVSLAGCYALNGEYKLALKTIKGLKEGSLPFDALIHIIRAQSFLGMGKIIKVFESCEKAIEFSKGERILQYLHSSTMILATIYRALNEKEKAEKILIKILKLLKKNKMMQDYYIRKSILEKSGENIPEEYKKEPFIKLVFLMKKANETKRIKDYNYALSYAVKKGIKGFFHRLCIFNPQIILKLIEKGKSKRLPKSLLKLPVFNGKYFVIKIEFLGKLKVKKIGFREEKDIRLSLSLKEKCFLIYLALKLKEPGNEIPCEEIYKNFWKDSKNPQKNLHRQLSRIKKILILPSHLLEIKKGNIRNNGIIFLTDYLEFTEIMTRAKALLEVNKGLAKKEFLSAFKLIRGKPFEKMYDRFSEDKRTEIIFKINDAFKEFLKTNPKKKEIEMIKKKFVKLKIPSV